VDLQGFIVDEIFVVKEFALREGHLSHYIFASPYPWDLLTKSERSCASWLIANHESLWIAMGRRDNPVQQGETVDYNGRDWYRRQRRQ